MLTRGRGAVVSLLFSAAFVLAVRPASVRALGGPSLSLHGFGTATSSAASYTLIVANLGDSAASGVSLALTLPSGAGLHSAVSTQGSCSGASCALGNVLPGFPVQITIETSFGSGPLLAVASFDGGSASATIAGINGPPTANTATAPGAPAAGTATTSSNGGLQQALIVSSCAGAPPGFAVARANGYALLVASGLGTPPLQCLAGGCSAVTLSLQAGLSTRDIVAAVEGTAVSGIWQYDTAAGRWRALYFAAARAPLDGVSLAQGVGQYTICVGGPGSIVSY